MEIKIPEIGESIQEVVVGHWVKKTGDSIERDELLLDLETDKINIEIVAEQSGVLTIEVTEGATVGVGSVIGHINTAEMATELSVAAVAAEDSSGDVAVNPAAAQLAVEQKIELAQVMGSGQRGRIVVEDVLATMKSGGDVEAVAVEMVSTAPEQGFSPPSEAKSATGSTADELIRRVPMSAIRKRIAQQLLVAQQQTATVTTFNDVDMTQLIALRKRQQQWFQEKYGVSLGLMSFFVKACVIALQAFPEVNARIDGDDIVYYDYVDMGIAVGTPRGLVVPVVRRADLSHFFEIEQSIADLASRAVNGKLKLQELQGGTFTLSNGGVYQSLLSTPLLNPPQSATLGMHRIEDRPVVRDQQVVVRSMMNVALSYDHRLIDGRQAIGFLNQVKEALENPDVLLLEN